MISDNGPQFKTPFRAWCDEKGILHVTSSPYHPRSNGLAKAAVKQAKKLLEKTLTREEFEKAMAYYQTAPHADGSPAPAALFCRRTPRMPGLPTLTRGETVTERGDQPEAFQIGQYIRLQDPITHRWDSFGVVSGCHDDEDARMTFKTELSMCLQPF